MQFLYFTVQRHLGELSSSAPMVLLLILPSLAVVIKVICRGTPPLQHSNNPLADSAFRGRRERGASFHREQEIQASPALHRTQLFSQPPLDLKNQIKMATMGVRFSLAANVTE